MPIPEPTLTENRRYFSEVFLYGEAKCSIPFDKTSTKKNSKHLALKGHADCWEGIQRTSVIFVKPGTMALARGLLRKMERICKSFIVICVNAA